MHAGGSLEQGERISFQVVVRLKPDNQLSKFDAI